MQTVLRWVVVPRPPVVRRLTTPPTTWTRRRILSVNSLSAAKTAGRQITNVAAGSADTDAVNVGQLKVTDERERKIPRALLT